MARKIALAFVFIWFFVGGLAHFFFTSAEMKIVPPSLPMPQLIVWVSGVFELIGAFGLLWSRTRTAAGYLLVLLTIAVTPANIYMWQHAEKFPAIPAWLLAVRLPAQLALIACIGWATRRARPQQIVPRP